MAFESAGTLGLPKGLPSTDLLSNEQSLEVGDPTLTSATDAPSPQTASEFVRWVNKQLVQHEPSVLTWREQAKDATRFRDGHQLSDEDIQILRSQRRPDTAINEIQKFLKFAGGIERRTQQALMFAPREITDQTAQTKGELIGSFYQWFIDQSSGQYERSLAFEDKLITGMGWVDMGITRVLDASGDPRYNKLDAFQMLWPESSKENLGFGTPSPVRWTGRESDMDLDEAIRKWPDQAMYLRAAAGGGANQDQFPDFGRGAGKPINYVVPWIMTEPLNKGGGAANTGKPGKVKILEWQYYDDEPGYYFFDPLEKDDTWLNNSDFRKYRARLKLLGAGNIQDYDPQDKRVFKRAFILQRRILLDDPKKLPTQTGYTWNCMTGTWDREDKCFYGIVRVLMSPQRYANAFFRQTLEVMGASFKGGGLFESNAMTKAQAQDIKDSGSTPGAWHAVQPGAIQQQKIMFKPPITMPQGSLEVLNFCIDIMDKITGLSQSLMGADQSNTAGVTLRKRLTSGMILLAAEFDQLSRFRKHEGHIIFDFMKLIADNRIINIGGPFDGQAIRLTKDPFALKYDIVLDEIEQDPNMRQVYQDAVLQLAPILIRTGNFIPDLLDYVNLPAQFRQKLKQGMQQQEQAKQQAAQQGLSVGGRGKPRSLAEIKAQEFLTQARGLEHITKSVEHLSKAKATSASTRRDNQRSVFDMAHSTAKMHQDDQKITLDALAKLFEALRPDPPQAPARKSE